MFQCQRVSLQLLRTLFFSDDLAGALAELRWRSADAACALPSDPRRFRRDDAAITGPATRIETA